MDQRVVGAEPAGLFERDERLVHMPRSGLERADGKDRGDRFRRQPGGLPRHRHRLLDLSSCFVHLAQSEKNTDIPGSEIPSSFEAGEGRVQVACTECCHPFAHGGSHFVAGPRFLTHRLSGRRRRAHRRSQHHQSSHTSHAASAGAPGDEE